MFVYRGGVGVGVSLLSGCQQVAVPFDSGSWGGCFGWVVGRGGGGGNVGWRGEWVYEGTRPALGIGAGVLRGGMGGEGRGGTEEGGGGGECRSRWTP